MKQNHRRSALFFVAILSAIAGSIGTASAQSSSYGVTDFGTIGGATSVAVAVDEGAFPDVYGYGPTASGNDHAWVGLSKPTDIGTLGGIRSEARGGWSGWVVGTSQVASGAYHAFMYGGYPGAMRDLGTLGGSQSYAEGVTWNPTTSHILVVGWSWTAGDTTVRPFLYDQTTGVLSEISATLGGANATAKAINANAHVAGWADLAGGQSHHAFLYANGATQDLGSLGTWSEALAINANDVVVGRSQLYSGGPEHAFLYNGGVMQDLGTLGGASSEALAVNASGTVAGWAETSGGARHAFIWRNGVMTDVNTMIRSGTGWVLQAATGIGKGAEAMVGYGQFQGQTRAFFLTPPIDLQGSLRLHMNDLDTNYPNPIAAGQRYTVGLTVWNNAAYDAPGVVVTNTLSGPVEILSVSGFNSDGAPACTQSGLQVTCNLGRVFGAGSGRDVMIGVRGTGPGVITHSASITAADPPDPNPSNNGGSESNTAVSLASLVLNQTTVVGGGSVLSRTTLTSNAPYGGATVALTSSNPDIASVPSQFDVLRGCCDDGMWREFYVTTKTVSAPVTVQISASYGLVTKTVPLTITPSSTPAPSPYGGAAWPIPGTIQAENFDEGGEGVAYHDTTSGNSGAVYGGTYRSTDVDLEPTGDAGGGYDVGWTTASEWLNYTVSVAASGTYTLTARVAANGPGGTFHVEFDGVNKTGPVTIPNTNGWQSWVDVNVPVTLSAGVQSMRFVEDANGSTGIFANVNYFRLTAQAAGGPTPHGGAAWPIPGTIQAENFDDGGEGIAYHDTTAGNSGAVYGGTYRSTDVDLEPSSDAGGGYDVGWTTAPEWLNYTVSVGASGTYTLTARVAANGPGGTFHVEFGGVDKTGSLTIPNTGGWQSWVDVTAAVTLSAGVQSMRFVEDANGSTGIFGNLNYIRLTTNATPSSNNIVLYATDAVPHGAWSPAADSSAAGGSKLLTADNGWSTISEPLAAPADYFEATFNAAAATPYTIWLRIRATADSKYNDSVWVQFSDALANGAQAYPIGSSSGLLVNLEPCNACGVSGWGWQNGAYWLSQATTVTFAASGGHTIRVQVREDGAQIDQIVLSPSQYLSAAPGPGKDDATIVPKQ